MKTPSFKGYSLYVSLMRFFLPLGILFSLGLAIGWPYFHSVSNEEEITIVDPSNPEIQESRMIQPRYVSTDKKGQPFHVNAEWAKQRTNDLADLVSPKGAMTMLEGQTFNLKAKEGQYDSEMKLLNLEGNVTLTSTDGYHIQTEKARINVDQKIVEGDVPIEGEGPTGKIKGEGFKVESRPQGKVLTLKGRSQVVINSSTLKKKESHAP